MDLDRRELAADLGRNADLGRAHDADDGGVDSGATAQYPPAPAATSDEAERDDALEPR